MEPASTGPTIRHSGLAPGADAGERRADRRTFMAFPG